MLEEKFGFGSLAKSSSPSKAEHLVEAPSVRKGEIFRAAGKGLQRLRTEELRSGGKYNRIDELPYNRITSMSYEERVMRRGSRIISGLGIILVLVGVGIPTLSTLLPIFTAQVLVSKIAGFENALVLPDLASVSLGVFLLASRFPRKVKEAWWQVKGQDLTPDTFHGWQIAGNTDGADRLVTAVKDGMLQARKASGTDSS